jgi:hypothetical protein
LHFPTTFLTSRRTTFFQLLNARSVSEVRQIEIHTAGQLVPAPSPFEFEIAIAKLGRYKSTGSNKIPAEPIQGGGETLEFEIYKPFNYISSKEELPNTWKESIIVPIYKKCDKTDYSNYGGITDINFVQYFMQYILLSKLRTNIDKIVGDYQCGFRRNR